TRYRDGPSARPEPVDLQRRDAELRIGDRRFGLVVDERLPDLLRAGAHSLDQSQRGRGAHSLDPVARPELPHRVTDVFLHRVPAEVQARADLRVRQALGDQAQDLELLSAEYRLRPVAVEQHAREPRREDPFAGERTLDGLDEIEILVVLEQVPA